VAKIPNVTSAARKWSSGFHGFVPRGAELTRNAGGDFRGTEMVILISAVTSAARKWSSGFHRFVPRGAELTRNAGGDFRSAEMVVWISRVHFAP